MATVINFGQLVARLPLYLVFLLICLQQTFGSTTLSPSEYVCPGDMLTYECTVMREAQTIWNGSAFDCPNSNNQITLSIFRQQFKQRGICTNATIRGQILSTEGTNYTSQLSITVTPDTAGKTAICFSDNGTKTSPVFSSVIPTIGRFSPPNELLISNVDISSRQLTFEWSPVAPDCPAIHYNILASNCGSCPTITNHTNVTCTDVPTNNNSVCTFAVQTVCGNITGNVSDPIRVNTGILYPTENFSIHKSDTNRVYIASIISLATALLVSAVVSVTAITIILRSKAKTKPALEQSDKSEGSMPLESIYDDVTGPSLSVSVAINTKDNVAYGQTKHQQPLYN